MTNEDTPPHLAEADTPAERVSPPVRQEADPQELALLLARCGDGDTAAFDALYAATSRRLYGLALRMLRDPQSAEDVLQDAYVSIWSRASSYERRLGEPMTWMSSIARYRALDQLRRRRHREDAQSPIEQHPLAAAIDGPSAEARSDDAAVLQRCLDRLAPGARACIVLAFCEGFSHDELSERFETPLGTVKSWIRRGTASLKGCLDELS